MYIIRYCSLMTGILQNHVTYGIGFSINVPDIPIAADLDKIV